MLESSNYPLRSTSKFDILAGCDEYIQHLKQRKNCLDMEMKLGAAAAASQQQGGCVGLLVGMDRWSGWIACLVVVVV